MSPFGLGVDGGFGFQPGNFEGRYLDHQWADGLRILQARSTRQDRVLAKYEHQRARSERATIEKLDFFSVNSQIHPPAELNHRLPPWCLWSQIKKISAISYH